MSAIPAETVAQLAATEAVVASAADLHKGAAAAAAQAACFPADSAPIARAVKEAAPNKLAAALRWPNMLIPTTPSAARVTSSSTTRRQSAHKTKVNKLNWCIVSPTRRHGVAVN